MQAGRRRHGCWPALLDDTMRVAAAVMICTVILLVKTISMISPAAPPRPPADTLPVSPPLLASASTRSVPPTPAPATATPPALPAPDIDLQHSPDASLPRMKPLQPQCQRSLSVKHRRLLCLGDSLTAGAYFTTRRKLGYRAYGVALQEALGDGWVVEYKGVPGWTVGEIVGNLEQILQKVKHREFDGVLLLSGMNDLLKSRGEPAEIAKASVQLADRLREHVSFSWAVYLKPPLIIPAARPKHPKLQKDTFYCTRGGFTNRRIRESNRALEKLVPGCLLWDPYDPLSQVRDVTQVWADCIHPNPDGSDRLGRMLAERLKWMLNA